MKHLLTLIILLCSPLAINAQTDEGNPSRPEPAISNGSGLRNIPVDNTAETKFKQISTDAGIYFKEGLLHFRDGKRSIARDKFDKSVEVFIMSGVNVRASRNLNDCYNQLIETVYRIEFPSNQQPQIRSLSATCTWNIDNKLADEVVAKLAQPAPQNNAQANKNLVTAIVDNKTRTIAPQAGFSEQDFEVSPLDELAKLELTPQEKDVEKPVIVPNNNNAPKTIYQRPTTPTITAQTGGVRVVKAQSGDTVAKIAARHGASTIEVARFNGLLPDSPLPAGREIRIPDRREIPNTPRITVPNIPYITIPKINSAPGNQPKQLKDGRVPVVMTYLSENLNAPYTMRFVRWSPIEKGFYNGQPCWKVTVKYRAKNTYGAYVLAEETFFIINNKVVGVRKV